MSARAALESTGRIAKTSAPSRVPVAAPAPARARIAVLGASGYSGLEFLRLALGHPGIDVTALASREHAGRPAADLVLGVDGRRLDWPRVVDPSALGSLLGAGDFDTLVTCLPHGAWTAIAGEQPMLEAEVERVIDLSSDRRDGSAGYVYGLPEVFRAAISAAGRLANPGCYPTAATLALLPALESGWIADPVFVSALSGASGAGRTASARTGFVELEGGASLYRVGREHSHVPEMERNFEHVAGSAISVGFAPQIVPMARGLLVMVNARLSRPVSPGEAYLAYCERYQDEPFVRVLDPESWPETRAVRGSNRCDVAVTTLHGGETLLATAAIDNLGKGAAGQALQNLNLMLGWPEETGLPVHGNPW